MACPFGAQQPQPSLSTRVAPGPHVVQFALKFSSWYGVYGSLAVLRLEEPVVGL
jgi:hypothetical protein